jgi:trigger factor
LERTVLEDVKNLTTIQASELIYQREMESIREDHERSLRNQRLDMDTYLRFVGQTAQEFEEQLRPQAEDRLATFLVMRKLAEQESIEVESDEIEAEIDRLTENSAEESVANLRRVLGSEESRESLRSSLLNRKVLAHLVEMALSNDEVAEDSDGDSGLADTVAEESEQPSEENDGDSGAPATVAEESEQPTDEGAATEPESASEEETESGDGEQSND